MHFVFCRYVRASFSCSAINAGWHKLTPTALHSFLLELCRCQLLFQHYDLLAGVISSALGLVCVFKGHCQVVWSLSFFFFKCSIVCKSLWWTENKHFFPNYTFIFCPFLFSKCFQSFVAAWLFLLPRQRKMNHLCACSILHWPACTQLHWGSFCSQTLLTPAGSQTSLSIKQD